MQPKKRIIPRGLRNNNPLNIRIGNTWLGERDHPTDNAFEEFVSLEYGYRAAFCILRRYIKRYHKDTIIDIVSTWAPASENDTQKYIDFVSKTMLLPPDAHIKYTDREAMVKLADAMTRYECGQSVDIKTIYKGYDIA